MWWAAPAHSFQLSQRSSPAYCPFRFSVSPRMEVAVTFFEGLILACCLDGIAHKTTSSPSHSSRICISRRGRLVEGIWRQLMYRKLPRSRRFGLRPEIISEADALSDSRRKRQESRLLTSSLRRYYWIQHEIKPKAMGMSVSDERVHHAFSSERVECSRNVGITD